MTDINQLAFHLVDEIHHKEINDIPLLKKWYHKTFAFVQKGHAGISDCHEAIVRLKAAGCIKVDGNNVETTPIGAAASMFYFDPFDVSALAKNITSLFLHERNNILNWAFALTCTPARRADNATVAEADEIEKWYCDPDVRKAHLNYSNAPGVGGESRMAYVFYRLMTGQNFFKAASLGSTAKNVKIDFARTAEMLECLDKLGLKWQASATWDELRCRVNYGVEAKYAPLVRLNGIGKVKATKLYEAGLTTLELISDNPIAIEKALKCKPEVAQQLASEAKNLTLELKP